MKRKSLKQALIQGAEDLYERALTPYWRLEARRHRDRHARRYVAVVGSVGKSTATEVSGRLLREQAPTAIGPFYNKERFVLRYLRRLNRPVDYFVQEISEFPLGTLATASRVLHPDIAVVTTIGLDHATAFRDTAHVRAEILPMVQGLPAHGVAVLNADDPEVMGLAAVCPCRVLTFGRSATADVRAESVTAIFPGRLEFDLVVGGTRRHVRTRFVGTTLLPSLLAALALVHAVGLELDRAVADLATVQAIANRQRVYTAGDQHYYVADIYKAPYWATTLLLDDLRNWGQMRRIIVLADVSDLGGSESSKLRRLLRQAAGQADLVVAAGRCLRAAEKVRLQHPNVIPAASLDEIRSILRAEPPSLVLLKSNSSYNLAGLDSGHEALALD